MSENNSASGNKRFGKSYHLLRRADFSAVYNGRIRSQDGVLIVLAARNRLPFSRLGLSVSKKVGNSVVRNRWKRLIREAFRLNRESIEAGFDYIVIPKRDRDIPDYPAVVHSLTRRTADCVKRLHRREAEKNVPASDAGSVGRPGDAKDSGQ